MTVKELSVDITEAGGVKTVKDLRNIAHLLIRTQTAEKISVENNRATGQAFSRFRRGPTGRRGQVLFFQSLASGAASEGDNPQEALENLKEALAGCIETYLDQGEPIPWNREAVFEDEAIVKRWVSVDV